MVRVVLKKQLKNVGVDRKTIHCRRALVNVDTVDVQLTEEGQWRDFLHRVTHSESGMLGTEQAKWETSDGVLWDTVTLEV